MRTTGYERAFGFGTLFAVLVTAGFWLFALPFYPRRCTVCKLTTTEAHPEKASDPMAVPTVVLLLFGFVLTVDGLNGGEYVLAVFGVLLLIAGGSSGLQYPQEGGGRTARRNATRSRTRTLARF